LSEVRELIQNTSLDEGEAGPRGENERLRSFLREANAVAKGKAQKGRGIGRIVEKEKMAKQQEVPPPQPSPPLAALLHLLLFSRNTQP